MERRRCYTGFDECGGVLHQQVRLMEHQRPVEVRTELTAETSKRGVWSNDSGLVIIEGMDTELGWQSVRGFSLVHSYSMETGPSSHRVQAEHPSPVH